jgi:hypothetical protein
MQGASSGFYLVFGCALVRYGGPRQKAYDGRLYRAVGMAERAADVGAPICDIQMIDVLDGPRQCALAPFKGCRSGR